MSDVAKPRRLSSGFQDTLEVIVVAHGSAPLRGKDEGFGTTVSTPSFPLAEIRLHFRRQVHVAVAALRFGIIQTGLAECFNDSQKIGISLVPVIPAARKQFAGTRGAGVEHTKDKLVAALPAIEEVDQEVTSSVMNRWSTFLTRLGTFTSLA